MVKRAKRLHLRVMVRYSLSETIWRSFVDKLDANYAKIRTHPNSVHAGHLHLRTTEKLFCNKSREESDGNTFVIPFRSSAAEQWKQHFAALHYGNCEKQEVQLQVLLVYLVF